MKLIDISILNAFSTLIRLVTGFVLNKFLSIYLGPSSIALSGQFLNYINIVTSFSNGGIGSGVIKYISEYENDLEKKQVISSGFIISLLFSISLTALTLIFNKSFSFLLLKNYNFVYIFNIFSTSIIFCAINSLVLCILNGYQEIRKFVYLNIASAIIGAIYSLLLVKKLGLDGILIAYSTSQAIFFILSFLVITQSKLINIKSLFYLFRKDYILKLLKFSMMNLISVLCVNLTMIYIRSYITDSLSLEYAGYWQSISKLSDMYLSFITSTLVVYYLPKLSSIKTNLALKNEIFKVAKLVLPILSIVNTFIYIYRDLVIKLVFTDKFLPMSDLFAFQMLGDFFKITSWILAFVMVSKAMTKEFIISEIVFSLIYIFLIIIFTSIYGFIGISYAWFLNYLLYTITMIIMFRKILFSNLKQ